MKFIKNKSQWKLYENLTQARKILKDVGKDENFEGFVYLKSKLKSHIGYIGWFTKMLIEEKIKSDDIDWLVDIINNDKFIIDSLPMDLVKYESFEKLIDDIQIVKYNRKIKGILNEFPSNVKSFFKNITQNERELLYRLADNKNKENFISKVSRYRTKSAFTSALELFLSSNLNSYDEILNAIKKVDADIKYNNREYNTIICEVNYQQIRKLGSDTSWCIVPSESTFNSYIGHYYKQYIIFLTDKTDKYSKIGATLGFTPKTQHLKNDSYIEYNELKNILKDRRFNLDSLLLTKDNILSKIDINKIPIGVLNREIGLDNEFILKNKNKFIESDLTQLKSSEIEKYNLKDKIEVKTLDGFKKLYPNDLASELIKNIDRLSFKLNIDDLMDCSPIPSQLDKLYNILYDPAKKSIDELLKYKDKPEKILPIIDKFYTFKSQTWDNKIVEQEDVDFLIFALKIGGVYPHTIDKKEILNLKLPYGYGVRFSTYDLIKIVKHLKLNGYDFNENDIYKLFKDTVTRASKSTFGSLKHEWLIVLDSFPIVKDKIKDVIVEAIGKKYFYDSELNTIKLNYPDIYDEAKKMSNAVHLYEEFDKIRLYKNYQNSESYVKTNVVGKGKSLNEWLQELYDKYIGGEFSIKDYKISSDKAYYFIVVILSKLGRLEELKDFNFTWFGFSNIYSIFVDIYFRKFEPINSPELKLTSKELDKYLDVIMKLDYPFDAIRKHIAFQLVYYLKDWGFSNYLRLIENYKTRIGSKIDKDGKLIENVEIQVNRIDNFLDIISYLVSKKKYSDAKKIIDTVMSWDMSKEEIKNSLRSINSSYSIRTFGDDNVNEWLEYISRYYKEEE